MQAIRDAATLLFLILVALSVRLDLKDAPLPVGSAHASESVSGSEIEPVVLTAGAGPRTPPAPRNALEKVVERTIIMLDGETPRVSVIRVTPEAPAVRPESVRSDCIS